MIIERCRELALRAPARVVFPDALDQRVLKAAQYLHQQGLATPILVANPFELRQFALSHGVAMDGLQVIDPHGNLAMREEFAHRWLARAGEKTPPDALEKLTDPLMFAAAVPSLRALAGMGATGRPGPAFPACPRDDPAGRAFPEARHGAVSPSRPGRLSRLFPTPSCPGRPPRDPFPLPGLGTGHLPVPDRAVLLT